MKGDFNSDATPEGSHYIDPTSVPIYTGPDTTGMSAIVVSVAAPTNELRWSPEGVLEQRWTYGEHMSFGAGIGHAIMKAADPEWRPVPKAEPDELTQDPPVTKSRLLNAVMRAIVGAELKWDGSKDMQTMRAEAAIEAVLGCWPSLAKKVE